MTLARVTRLTAVFGPAAVLLTLSAGCGGEPQFGRETQYTPESVAQELAFRFKALPVSGKTSTRVRRPRKQAVASKADEKSAVKSQAKAASKKPLARTADDLLDDAETKAGLVPGMHRVEALKKVREAVSRDRSLGETDRKTLVDRLDEMAGP
jgi:hypothetical protein